MKLHFLQDNPRQFSIRLDTALVGSSPRAPAEYD